MSLELEAIARVYDSSFLDPLRAPPWVVHEIPIKFRLQRIYGDGYFTVRLQTGPKGLGAEHALSIGKTHSIIPVRDDENTLRDLYFVDLRKAIMNVKHGKQGYTDVHYVEFVISILEKKKVFPFYERIPV